jgi:hypothetical protein
MNIISSNLKHKVKVLATISTSNFIILDTINFLTNNKF